ncbi:ABC transporter substrate-binding protein [Halosolutus gelatinilyticus]|uniref:ABC transporter substrate-binding protein n=1 Tax=Halosolutus gelatinilyticus TaxID=2931975 RepID=UPI001FF1ED88|nr:ABC transporter substrate-binding protein [Halosolutus gelatinilyticus]
MPAKKHRQEYLSRRQILATTGVTGATALAGCFGGDDDPSDLLGGDFDEVDIDHPENYEEEMNEAVPSGAVNPYNGEYIFNPYHHAWNPGDAQETMYEYLAIYHTGDGEFIPRIAEDWEIDEETRLTTITISDEYGWSDGTPVTAGDFVTKLKLEGYMQMGINEYVDPGEGIRVVDDHTFEIEPREEYVGLEEDLWLNQWIEVLLDVSEEQFGPVVEKFENASSDDEIEEVQRNLVSLKPHWNQILASGPFMFVEANEEFADQVPNQHHPIAKDFDFYLRHGEYEGEQGLQAGEVDWEHNNPTLEDLPDKYGEPPVSFSGQTFAIIFGRDDEYIRDYPEVRKAIAYAVDMEHLVDVVTPETPVDEYSAGIDVGYIEHFVEEDVLNAMPNYAPEDLDTARDLLEGVGFSYENGEWYTPDGDRWTLHFPVGDWFRTASEIISNNLAEFGIKMDYYVSEMQTWQSEHQADLKYDLTVHLNYGMARQYHAHSDLYEEMNNPDRGILTERNLFGEEVEVPEVGNPDGDAVTINIPDALNGLATAGSQDEAMKHATDLAWMHNQLLPAAMVHPWSEHYWVNAGEWDFDLESNAWLTSNRITHYLLEHGLSPQ